MAPAWSFGDQNLEGDGIVPLFQFKGRVTNLTDVSENQVHSLVNSLQVPLERDEERKEKKGKRRREEKGRGGKIHLRTRTYLDGDISVLTRLRVSDNDTSSRLVTNRLDDLTGLANNGTNHGVGDLKAEGHNNPGFLAHVRHIHLFLSFGLVVHWGKGRGKRTKGREAKGEGRREGRGEGQETVASSSEGKRKERWGGGIRSLFELAPCFSLKW